MMDRSRNKAYSTSFEEYNLVYFAEEIMGNTLLLQSLMVQSKELVRIRCEKSIYMEKVFN